MITRRLLLYALPVVCSYSNRPLVWTQRSYTQAELTAWHASKNAPYNPVKYLQQCIAQRRGLRPKCLTDAILNQVRNEAAKLRLV